MTEVEKLILRKLGQINDRLDQMATALDQIYAMLHKRAKKADSKKQKGTN